MGAMMGWAFHERTLRAHRTAALSPMAEDVRAGLLSRPPLLSSKYFYDDRGSALFEEITRLPEYYQTRTEESILARVARDIIARSRPVELVELGSGAGRKIRLLIDALLSSEAGPTRPRLVLFDINERFVQDSAQRLSTAYPGLDVHALVGDFTDTLEPLGPGGGRLAVLFAGTIGNLVPFEATRFLRRTARHLAPGDGFLVGLDLVKERSRLERAYNDAAGVTAAFNLNILAHVNRELDGDFDLSRWRHLAFYDDEREWIEMRLVSTERQRVRIAGARLDLTYAPGDEIITEYSCKYTRESFNGLLAGTGLEMEAWYADPERLFALALLTREEP
jgi:L-histidine N-alpha-methyltransferase